MLKLYHGTTSVCSAKVRAGLAELGLNWTGQILNLSKGEQNDDWYLSLNPKGVVPTLVDGSLVVVESSVILEYLAEIVEAKALLPTDPTARARARMWLMECTDIHAAIIPVPGGVLIRNADSITIGAVGISGDTSDKDEFCAIEAIRNVGLLSEPSEPDSGWRDSSLSDTYPGSD